MERSTPGHGRWRSSPRRRFHEMEEALGWPLHLACLVTGAHLSGQVHERHRTCYSPDELRFGESPREGPVSHVAPRNGRGASGDPVATRCRRATPQLPLVLWSRPVGSVAWARLLGTVRTL